jgi:glycosyltransferase involved in cell wall biosynthesis
MRRRVPELRVLVVGEGEERAKLEALIAELELGGIVTLLGRRTDVPDLLRAFDVAVCSSDFEGTPLSILEYMEAALPVVATSVGGVPDLIEDGLNGLLVPARDPAALADATVGLLTEPARAEAMGRRGRDRRRSEFDIANTIGRIEELYEALVSSKRA